MATDTDTPPETKGAHTRNLAALCAGLRFEDLPAEVVAHVKLLILDGLGCCLQGATLPWTQMVADMVREEGGVSEATLIGMTGRATATQAALVNSTAGHGFEMDDIHRDAIIHPNSLTVPSALAVAERGGGAAGADFIAAVVAGYEVAARIGRSAGQSLLLKGFHPQGTTGAFAATAAAARMLGLDAGQTHHAFGVGGSLGAGLIAAQEGAMVKRLHSGRAAQAGVQAALLAERGFTGIEDVIEADYGGFLRTHAEGAELAALDRGVGESWEILQSGYKLYPTVTSIHNALHALREVMREREIEPHAIAAIESGVSKATYVHSAWPYHGQSVTAAQMNLFYGLAVMALKGRVTTAEFTEDRIADPAILAYAERITAFVDPEIEALGTAQRHAVNLKVRLESGKIYEKGLRLRPGSPEAPADPEDVREKFRHNAAFVLTDDAIGDIEAKIDSLEALKDVRELAAPLTPGEG